MPEEKPPEEKPSCPFCLKPFETEEELRGHVGEHNVIDIYNSLDARLGSRLSEFAAATGKVTADLVSKMAMINDERFKEMEKRIAERSKEAESKKETEPRRETAPRTETEPDEVSMGEQARLESGAQAVAEGARRAGIDIRGEHIGPILGGLGQLVIGIRGAPRGEDPFSEAGRAMFSSFAKAMSEATARVLGRRVGEAVVEHE